MNKRKIEINELKKIVYKGKKMRTITVKYQTVLAYFKQKDAKDLNVFQITFTPLINDLLNQLATTQFVDRLQSQSKEALRPITSTGSSIKLETFELKALSKEFPIQEICSCLVLQGGDKRHLTIHRSKLMNFFKQLRSIYSDFCYCAGEKIVVEPGQLKLFYELFQAHWNKNQQKGRLNALERLERKICKSLHFLGILIENNILSAIEAAQRRKKEEESDCGTRSQHKKNIKGINQQVSTVHTFSSLDPSSLSVRLKSQTSQQQHFPISRNNLSNYSQKSQKIVSRSRYDLWDKAQLKQLKFKLKAEPQEQNSDLQNQKYEINYLSNDVENILIQQAFKIEKHFTNPMEKAGQYIMVDYSTSMYPHSLYQQQYSNYYMQSYYPYSYGGMAYQHNYLQPQIAASLYENNHSGDANQLNQLKRSLGCLNLVQTRKKDIDRYQ